MGHSEDVFAPDVSLVDPLSVLLARGRWTTLALDRAALADGPEWFGLWPQPGAQLGLRVAIDDRPPASMLKSYNFVEFIDGAARAGVENAAEAVGHFRRLVTDVDQGSYVLKDAVRDRPNWTGNAVFELSMVGVRAQSA